MCDVSENEVPSTGKCSVCVFIHIYILNLSFILFYYSPLVEFINNNNACAQAKPSNNNKLYRTYLSDRFELFYLAVCSGITICLCVCVFVRGRRKIVVDFTNNDY